MSVKKIQPADPKATAPAATEANAVEDKTADRKAAGTNGRFRKTNGVHCS